MTKNADFEAIVADAPNTRTVTWYQNTEILDAQTGERKSSFDGGTTISGMYFVVRKPQDWHAEGFRAEPDSKLYVSADYNIQENDKVTISGVSYEIIKVEKTVSDAEAPIFHRCFMRVITTEG